MSRPLWKGSIAFGLVSIPVSLYSAENRTTDLHFHLLDSRSHAPIKYVRVNQVTGKEVPWNKIVKAYEFEKNNYVIVDEKELEKTAAKNFHTIEIQDFVDEKSIESIYFDKPYYLVPMRQGEKGYALLRKTLEHSKKIGIVKVVIRTKQYLAALSTYEKILLLSILRFEKELRRSTEFKTITNDLNNYKISSKEIQIAECLVESMSSKWEPKKYHDENRELLDKLIRKKVQNNKYVASPLRDEEIKKTSGKVIDFLALLKDSIQQKSNQTKQNSKPKILNQNKSTPKIALKRKHASKQANKSKKTK